MKPVNKPALSVKTNKGTINVYTSDNPEFPGVELSFVMDEGDGETDVLSIPRIIFEECDGKLRALIWNNPDDEDYTQKIVFVTPNTPKKCPKVEKMDGYDYASFIAEELNKREEVGVILNTFIFKGKPVKIFANVSKHTKFYSVHSGVQDENEIYTDTLYDAISLNTNDLGKYLQNVCEYYKVWCCKNG